YPGNESLKQTNKQLQLQNEIRLSEVQQKVVREAILNEAKVQGQHILAISVNATPVHIVAEYISQPISNIVAYSKKASRLALKTIGHNGKLWTKGYDKRFCFDQRTLQRRIKYVQLQTPGETGG
ncbi:MAG: hypothetical protein ACE5NM_14110, partial [Sedimentisphaerales bacterium]